MSDLISRQDAIDYIKTQRGRPFIGITLEEAIIMMIEEVPSVDPEPSQVARDIATIIENEQDMRVLLSQPEPQWIPCSERPPKKLEDVLLQFSHNMGVGFLDDDGWYVNTGDRIYSEVGKDEENPIAWMPLPKQYGGEQE